MSGSKRERPGSNGSVKAKSAAKPEIVPIYARLPKGPHQLGVAGVARNQRLRIHGGMIEAVATIGYPQTSIRHVVGFAGVSRRAFYEQFSSKEDCFMATFDLIVKRAIRRFTQACRTTEGDLQERMHMALAALGAEMAENPKALRLVLVDAPTVSPQGLERLRKTTTLCEQRLAAVLSDRGYPHPDRPDTPPRPDRAQPLPDRSDTTSPPDRAQPHPDHPDTTPPPVVRAIVGGLRRTTSTGLGDSQPETLQCLVEEMAKWSLLFSSPAAAQLQPRPWAAGSPAQPAVLEPDACGGQSSRGRLLRSAIELRVQVEKPDEFNSLRIADGARLPIEDFMELFSGPEECYLEALTVLGDELLQLVADSGLASSAEWPAAVCRTIVRLLAHLAGSPARPQTFGATVFEAGPSAVENVERLLYQVATLLTQGAPTRPRTGIAVEAIAGALWQILHHEAFAARSHRLPVLCEYLSYVVLAPFIGPEAAVAAIVCSREAPADVRVTPAAVQDAHADGTQTPTSAQDAHADGTQTPTGGQDAPADVKEARPADLAANGTNGHRAVGNGWLRPARPTDVSPSVARRSV